MQLENSQLNEEHEKVFNLLSRCLEKHLERPEWLISPISLKEFSRELELEKLLNQRKDESPSLYQSLGLGDGISLYKQMEISDREKALMSEVATSAMEELVRLLHINDPFWVKSSAQDGKLTLHSETYKQHFPVINHFKDANKRIESSKDSGIVNLSGMQLVDMFLDSDKWVNLFPTIVAKAETIEVIESGSLENRSGALQLMYEEMHILSPLVQPREFHFLRYCQQVEVGLWVITDVSIDSFQRNIPISCSWRYPSGCMIREMPYVGCMCVSDKYYYKINDNIHWLYKDLIGTNIAYGAERWIKELQRMCDRFICYWVEKIPNHDDSRIGTNSLEGRRSIMKLSHRMVKMFCESLTMSDQLNFPDLTKENNCGLRVAVRKSNGIDQPNGIVIAVATSLWLPYHHQKVFEFFTDDKYRAKWDFLSFENPVQAVSHISTGFHPGNCTSIIRPDIPRVQHPYSSRKFLRSHGVICCFCSN